ncbi:MAG: hypothetical protein E3J72_17895 [Planctomycetota bacterium]|nr:MAG: hypothetical protein E3J72_17895 [Planctomycetota bacterium]
MYTAHYRAHKNSGPVFSTLPSKGRNPQTGETIQIKASKTIGFKPGRDFKSYI